MSQRPHQQQKLVESLSDYRDRALLAWLELGAQFEDRDGDYEEDDGDDEPGHGDASDEDPEVILPVNAGAGGVVEPCPLGVRVYPLCMCSLLNQDIKQ